MTLFLNYPDDDPNNLTFANAGIGQKGIFDGALGYLPPVALLKAEAGLAGDLLDDDRRARMAELYSANDESQTFIDNTFSREDARVEAYRRRIEKIHAATGVQLRNPMELERSAAIGNFIPSPDPFGTRQGFTDFAADQVADFNRQLGELKLKHPDQAALFDPNFDPDTKTIVAGAETRRKKADANAEELGTLSRLGASFLGSARGALRDPLQIATLFVGGPASRATSVAGRIGQTILTEAIVNGAAEAPVQVAAQKWRAENGLESGVVPGLKQVGLAALFGGGIGGLVAGAREISRVFKIEDKAGREAIERVAIGEPEQGDLKVVTERLGVPIDAIERQTADIARAEPEVARAAFGEPPRGLTADEVERLARNGLRHVETDDVVPAGPVVKAERAEEQPGLFGDDLPATSLDIKDRPIAFERFDPKDVGTDAGAYQYKGGGDGQGVTKRLAGVTKWDAVASGKVVVHERRDGRRFIADGHQRLGLAKKLQAEGQSDVRLDGYLFREADGWTAEDVRALAAKKNLQEGSGEAIDAARVMRDRPDILDDGLPMSGPMMRKATGLARLSDDAWRMAVNGLVDENHAALVGELLDPAIHSAAIADLAKFAPETDRAARLLLEEIVASGVRHESQTDMFGSFDLTRSLIGERVKVLDAAMRTLKGDKRLFAMLANRADVIEAAGNQLDNAGNASRAVTAETIGEIVDRLARTKGPVSDALTQAAVRFSEGSAATKEARAFVDQVQGLIERDGLKRLLNPPEPQLAHGRVDEPATREALEAAEGTALEASRVEQDLDAEPPKPSLWDMIPDGADADGTLRHTSAADLFARADRDGYLSDTVAFCEV